MAPYLVYVRHVHTLHYTCRHKLVEGIVVRKCLLDAGQSRITIHPQTAGSAKLAADALAPSDRPTS